MENVSKVYNILLYRYEFKFFPTYVKDHESPYN